MKFKIDENLPAEYVLVLRNSGLEADTVGDEALSGADDVTVFDLCQKENRMLVTLDLDFSNMGSRWRISTWSADVPNRASQSARAVPRRRGQGGGE